MSRLKVFDPRSEVRELMRCVVSRAGVNVLERHQVLVNGGNDDGHVLRVKEQLGEEPGSEVTEKVGRG